MLLMVNLTVYVRVPAQCSRDSFCNAHVIACTYERPHIHPVALRLYEREDVFGRSEENITTWKSHTKVVIYRRIRKKNVLNIVRVST